ncbi:reverse transcriptase domain-containing protein [Tanacetum coccineum]
MPEKNKEEASGSREKPQEELVPTPKAWRLYVGREAVKEGFIVGMILNSPERKMFSYAIRLNFHTSEDSMDYEALLARLTASTGRGMKDLHVFVGSKLLVDQVEGSRIPRTKEAKKYREEVKDVTAPFHRKGSGRNQERSKEGDNGNAEPHLGRAQWKQLGEAIRLRAGGMTQDPLDGQPHIYSQFVPNSEQQAMFSGKRAPPL